MHQRLANVVVEKLALNIGELDARRHFKPLCLLYARKKNEEAKPAFT
jgi:hypothetical protein